MGAGQCRRAVLKVDNREVKLSEFERTLESGKLIFHCSVCDSNWVPSTRDIEKFRKVLASTELTVRLEIEKPFPHEPG